MTISTISITSTSISNLTTLYHDYNESVNKRPKTIYWYRESLKPFLAFVGPDTPAGNITTATIDAYRQHLIKKEPRLAISTVNNRLRAVQGLLRWAAGREYIERLPKVEYARLDRAGAKPAFADGELEKLLAAAEQENYLLLRLRARAILYLLYDCGPRASELVAARYGDISHIELDGQVAHLLKIEGAKRGGPRQMVLAEKTWAAIKEYRDELARPGHGRSRRLDQGQDPGWLFVGRYFEPMSVSGLQRLIYRLAERAGLEDCHPHKFRRTFATSFYASMGGDEGSGTEILMKLGGWKDRRSLDSYLTVETETLVRAARKHSPLSAGGNRAR